MSDSKSNGNGKNPVKVGLYICHCGTNISKMVDVAYIAEKMTEHPNVEVSNTINLCVLNRDRNSSLKTSRNTS